MFTIRYLNSRANGSLITPITRIVATKPLSLRQDKQYLYFGQLFPCTPGSFFAVVRHFFWRIPTEQALYYKNLGLYYGLASGTLPL